jgi:Protein of unknown function (DUF1592)/Protein of unknown function (DUF1588)/Protein of unknown function (DUF1585)/Protein of unknown function (DUF1587)/Protein of unknown function (DUF1595)/Planctomycete cytochrome C
MADSRIRIRCDRTIARRVIRKPLGPLFVFLFGIVVITTTHAAEMDRAFLITHCASCHRGEFAEGGLDFDKLETDLNDPLTFSRWERIHDRIELQEMPPRDEVQPSPESRQAFVKSLGSELVRTHAQNKETVLRRLNRREYQNTLNDLFGTNLSLADRLPEDNRSHEFDTVGESLGISLIQMQRYLECIQDVLNQPGIRSVVPDERQTLQASYARTRGSEQWLNKLWLHREDDSVVLFKSFSYPTGLLQAAVARKEGWYNIRVSGYAFQSDKPITFWLGASSFGRGAEEFTLGYFELPPDKLTTIETRAWLPLRYMLNLAPQGITDRNQELKKEGVLNYKGPGIAIQFVELEGPIADPEPERGRKLVYDGLVREVEKPAANKLGNTKAVSALPPIVSENPTEDAEKVLDRIATKAFRRPITQDVVKPYLKLFQTELDRTASFEEAIHSAIAAIFCDPKFLYLTENRSESTIPSTEKPRALLDDYSIASRLSYFLTRTLPDEALLQAAGNEELSQSPMKLLEQAARLQKSPYFRRFIEDFTDAWLNLREIDFTNPDVQLYPEYDQYLRWSMLEETRAFFAELIETNQSVSHFVKSDFAMLNHRLAEHYGIEGVEGPNIRRVSLPEGHLRGGLLTQASILKVSANGTSTSPVVRGVWVMDRILGQPPPPPPPGVPGVEPDIRGVSTLRELLDRHRSLDTCRSCHQKIDPPGFALEMFDPIGGVRTHFRSIGRGDPITVEVSGQKVRYLQGPSVDASGEFGEGQKFSGFADFRELLLKNKRQIAKSFTTKLVVFATGREMGFSDRDEIDRIVEKASESNYGIRTIFELIISSPLFKQP